MAIRIQGLVRAARHAQAEFRAGFDSDERHAFLERVRGVVRHAETLLEAHATEACALPRPSRDALAVLRRLGAHEPSALPVAVATRRARRPLRLKNIVKRLDVCLDGLADGCPDERIVEETRLEAELMADAIERVCVMEDRHTADLPVPSRNAYAMLRWLSNAGNMERYVTQVRLAIRVVRQVLEGPCEFTAPRAARVRFEPKGFRTSLPRTPQNIAWRFSVGCLAANAEDLAAVTETMALGGEARPAARERKSKYFRSEACGALELEFERLADPTPFHAGGAAYDLGVLFERLDRRLLRGTVPRPHLHWQETLSRRVFGLYVAALDLACLNPILDDPTVPEFVAEVVLYHELLHKKHGVRFINGRSHVHTPAFKAEERLHPRLAESDLWLHALAAGLPHPPRLETKPSPMHGTPRAPAALDATPRTPGP